MKEKAFYDIHMHALNLSHPHLLAFIQRLKIPQIPVLNSILGPIASLLIGQNLNKIKNLLAVMENDIGSFFLMMEDYLKKDDGSPLLRDGRLHISGNVYSKIVLTPLMMDFGYKIASVAQILRDFFSPRPGSKKASCRPLPVKRNPIRDTMFAGHLFSLRRVVSRPNMKDNSQSVTILIRLYDPVTSTE